MALNIAIGIGILIVALVAWIAGARQLSLLLDRFHTVEIGSRPVAQLGIERASGSVRINEISMDTAMPDYRPYPMETKVDSAGNFVLRVAGQSITLGSKEDSSGGPVVRPQAGDRARLHLERSMLSWPTPLEMNFMTGRSPSWKRHVYHRLVWEKATGGRFEMLWRYEQYFYDQWASGEMTREGTTGLIRVDIRP